MNGNELENIISSNFKNKECKSVIVSGKWGVGKTYSVNRAVDKFIKSSDYKKCCVSVYGAEKLDEILLRLFYALDPESEFSKKSKIKKAISKLKFSFSIKGLINIPLDLSFLRDYYDIGENKEKKIVYIFDDIERSDIKLNVLFSLINEIKENCKNSYIIGICNSEKIKDTSLYEKVFDMNYEITNPNPKIYDEFLKNNDIKCNELDVLLKSIVNIRTLQYISSKYKTLIRLLSEEKLELTDSNKEKIFKYCVYSAKSKKDNFYDTKNFEQETIESDKNNDNEIKPPTRKELIEDLDISSTLKTIIFSENISLGEDAELFIYIDDYISNGDTRNIVKFYNQILDRDKILIFARSKVDMLFLESEASFFSKSQELINDVSKISTTENTIIQKIKFINSLINKYKKYDMKKNIEKLDFSSLSKNINDFLLDFLSIDSYKQNKIKFNKDNSDSFIYSFKFKDKSNTIVEQLLNDLFEKLYAEVLNHINNAYKRNDINELGNSMEYIYDVLFKFDSKKVKGIKNHLKQNKYYILIPENRINFPEWESYHQLFYVYSNMFESDQENKKYLYNAIFEKYSELSVYNKKRAEFLFQYFDDFDISTFTTQKQENLQQ